MLIHIRVVSMCQRTLSQDEDKGKPDLVTCRHLITNVDRKGDYLVEVGPEYYDGGENLLKKVILLKVK